MECGSPGSSVHGILQAGILEWVFAIPFSRGSSWLRARTCISCIGGLILYHWATRSPKRCIPATNIMLCINYVSIKKKTMLFHCRNRYVKKKKFFPSLGISCPRENLCNLLCPYSLRFPFICIDSPQNMITLFFHFLFRECDWFLGPIKPLDFPLFFILWD